MTNKHDEKQSGGCRRVGNEGIKKEREREGGGELYKNLEYKYKKEPSKAKKMKRDQLATSDTHSTRIKEKKEKKRNLASSNG